MKKRTSETLAATELNKTTYQKKYLLLLHCFHHNAQSKHFQSNVYGRRARRRSRHSKWQVGPLLDKRFVKVRATSMRVPIPRKGNEDTFVLHKVMHLFSAGMHIGQTIATVAVHAIIPVIPVAVSHSRRSSLLMLQRRMWKNV